MATMKLRQFFAQGLRGGIGIKPQAVIDRRFDGREHFGRRRVGIFVRVELDQPFDLWLLARHVAVQFADDRTDQ